MHSDDSRVPARVLTSKRPAPVAPTEFQAPATLVDSSWRLQADEAVKILSENTDFQVIGVLGTQGTGKSSLLNAICGLDAPAFGAVAARPFPQQSPSDVLQLRHCTSTVDLQVHPQERIIAIDTPPIFSLSVLAELMQATRLPSGVLDLPALRGMRHRQASYEGVQLITALQTACWLCSVCHMVLITADDFLDPTLLEFLQLVDIGLHSLPDPFPPPPGHPPNTNTTTGLKVGVADVVFVSTGMKLEQLGSSQLQEALLQPLAAALECTSFAGSVFIPTDSTYYPLSTRTPRPQPHKAPLPISVFPLPLQQPVSFPPLAAHTPSTTSPHAAAARPAEGTPQPTTPPSHEPSATSHGPTATRSGRNLTQGTQTSTSSGTRRHATGGPPGAPAPATASSKVPPPGHGVPRGTAPASAGQQQQQQGPAQDPDSWLAAVSPDPVAVQALRNQVLGAGRRPLPRGLTERGWLKAADKAWEAVGRSPVLKDAFTRLVATAAGTGGLYGP